MRGYTTNPASWSWSGLLPLLVVGISLAAMAVAACGGGDDDAESVAEVEAQTDAARSDDLPSGADEEEDQPSDAVQEEVEEEAQAAPPDFPISLTDDTGVEVTVAARPERVIAVLPSAVDLIVDLGLVDRLVGVDDFSLDRVPDVASVGGNNFTFNIEAVAQLEPDLLIVAVGGTEELAQQARELGLPVYSIAFPAGLVDVFDQLRLIGRLLGERGVAEQLAAELEDRLLAVTQRVAESTASEVAPLRVYLEVDQSTPTQPFSIGPGSLHQEIIELAGGQNIFAPAESSFPQVNWESIIAADPEVILLLDSKEFGGELAFNPVSAEEVGERTGWNLISAVRHGRVVPLPNDLFSVGAGLVDALEHVAEALAAARAQSEAEADAA